MGLRLISIANGYPSPSYSLSAENENDEPQRECSPMSTQWEQVQALEIPDDEIKHLMPFMIKVLGDVMDAKKRPLLPCLILYMKRQCTKMLKQNSKFRKQLKDEWGLVCCIPPSRNCSRETIFLLQNLQSNVSLAWQWCLLHIGEKINVGQQFETKVLSSKFSVDCLAKISLIEFFMTVWRHQLLQRNNDLIQEKITQLRNLSYEGDDPARSSQAHRKPKARIHRKPPSDADANEWMERTRNLKELSTLIDWEFVENVLDNCNMSGPFRKSQKYDPFFMFKAILLGRWYNLDDERLEGFLCISSDFVSFTGLQPIGVPDRLILCQFRSFLTDWGLDKVLFEDIEKQFEQIKYTFTRGASCESYAFTGVTE